MHFPQTDDGTYAGHHPADSSDAISHLESLRGKGARFFVIPATSGWWLEHYADLARHLAQDHTRLPESGRHFVAFALKS